MIVPQRNLAGFADCLEPREVNDRIRLVLCEEGKGCVSVAEVKLREGRA